MLSPRTSPNRGTAVRTGPGSPRRCRSWARNTWHHTVGCHSCCCGVAFYFFLIPRRRRGTGWFDEQPEPRAAVNDRPPTSPACALIFCHLTPAPYLRPCLNCGRRRWCVCVCVCVCVCGICIFFVCVTPGMRNLYLFVAKCLSRCRGVGFTWCRAVCQQQAMAGGTLKGQRPRHVSLLSVAH